MVIHISMYIFNAQAINQRKSSDVSMYKQSMHIFEICF